MMKILAQYAVCAPAVALMVPLAKTQPARMQATLGKMTERFPTNSPDSRGLCRAKTTGSPARAFARVAQIVVHGSMKGVGPGFGCDVHDTASIVPILGAHVVCRNPKLLDEILRDDHAIDIVGRTVG